MGCFTRHYQKRSRSLRSVVSASQVGIVSLSSALKKGVLNRLLDQIGPAQENEGKNQAEIKERKGGRRIASLSLPLARRKGKNLSVTALGLVAAHETKLAVNIRNDLKEM